MAAASTIVEFLGGRKALGVKSTSAVDWDALIRAGMPVQSAEALKESIAVTDSLLAELLGVSEKTLSRARACKGRLDPVTSDRLFRVARIVALAIEVLESEASALHWLKRPQIGLGGKVPLALLATDPGRDQVEKLLLRIEHGVYSQALPTAYRIVKARHAGAAFSGEGARLAGGRWNRPGQAVVYASGSLALAAIETFVHLGEDALHIEFVHFRIEIPDAVAIQCCRRSPPGWRAEPPEESSMRYGSRWLQQGRTAVLEVPSAIVPSEMNYLLNPIQPDFRRIRVGRPLPFLFDPRMWKQRCDLLTHWLSLRALLAVLALSAVAGAVSADRNARGADGLRDRRSCELIVVKRDGLHLKATVYNTLGLNDCPQEKRAALNEVDLKRQFDAAEVMLNGPRHQVFDGIVAGGATAAGATIDVGGLGFTSRAVLQLPVLGARSKP